MRAIRPPRRHRAPAIAEMREGLRHALRSPLLRWMSVGSILFSLLFFSLYLPFSRAAVERYPQPDDLAGFFGLFMGVSTAVTLVLSLLVMNRLLSKLGVPTVMLVLPVLYLFAFGVLTVASSFAILLAFRFAQVVWLQGGATSAWEAVINTVPGDRRDRMRAFLYGGPTQVGTVLAGLVVTSSVSERCHPRCSTGSDSRPPAPRRTRWCAFAGPTPPSSWSRSGRVDHMSSGGRRGRASRSGSPAPTAPPRRSRSAR